jgi:hypothetical protein
LDHPNDDNKLLRLHIQAPISDTLFVTALTHVTQQRLDLTRLVARPPASALLSWVNRIPQCERRTQIPALILHALIRGPDVASLLGESRATNKSEKIVVNHLSPRVKSVVEAVSPHFSPHFWIDVFVSGLAVAWRWDWVVTLGHGHERCAKASAAAVGGGFAAA